MNSRINLPVTSHDFGNKNIMEMSERLTGLIAVRLGLDTKTNLLIDIWRIKIIKK